MCEGNKTERIYFNRFRKRGNNLQILTPDTKYTDPGNLVDFAIEQKRALDLNTNTGDRVWCVFDVDENTSKPIDDAVKKAGSNDIGIVLSNPCFEVWYLLHYCDWTRARNGKEVVKELVAYLPPLLKVRRYL